MICCPEGGKTESTTQSQIQPTEVDDRDTLIFYVSRPVASALSGTIAYVYDNTRCITEAIYPRSIYAKTNKYTYDKVGNRLRKIAGTDTTIYTYNKRNNQLMTEGTSDSYYYDDNGNMMKFQYATGTDTLVYDFENRLTRYVKGTKIPPSYDTSWFNYCGLGKRISKIEKPHGQSPDTSGYAYDGIYAVCEFGGHLDLLSKYVYANGMLLARYDAVGDSHYYHYDGLGSIMGMTDEDKSVEQSYFYDEFGISLGSWGNVGNHYLYTGQEYDGSVTQLYNLRARYYKVSIGRFISEDPDIGYVHMPQQRNRYPYVWNMPLILTDPLGLFSGCRVLTRYPVKTEKYLVGEKKEIDWEFLEAHTTGLDPRVPVIVFWVFCDWMQMTSITRVYREIVIWSYVLKCWEECQPPLVKAYDVIVYGPLSTEFMKQFRMKTKILRRAYDIITDTPSNRLKWELECLKARHP